MNYKIIYDEVLLQDFINFLPDLKPNEKYFVALFARKKYFSNILSNDKTLLKRFVSYKENLFIKIKQLECEIGSYKLKHIDAPQESLVLYINPNPRDMKKATYDLIRKCTTLLQSDAQRFNIHAEALSSLQRNRGSKHFIDFDIDTKDCDISLMAKILPLTTYDIIETKGGYHILVDLRKVPQNMWYNEIKNTFNVDQVGDQLLPIPGCTQGGFIPHFIKF